MPHVQRLFLVKDSSHCFVHIQSSWGRCKVLFGVKLVPILDALSRTQLSLDYVEPEIVLSYDRSSVAQ